MCQPPLEHDKFTRVKTKRKPNLSLLTAFSLQYISAYKGWELMSSPSPS